MAKREILVLPDARLRQVADPIEKIDASIKALAKDMLDTMYDAPGIDFLDRIGHLAQARVGQHKNFAFRHGISGL